MIYGLKLDVKAKELMALLHGRIEHHESKIKSYETQPRRGTTRKPVREDDADVSKRYGDRESPKQRIARKKREHEERAALLKFVRDHVVPGEVYRLDESDLRLTEVMPERIGRWSHW